MKKINGIFPGEKQRPLFIWLSEIILQQTRLDQGLPYYESFSLHFPTVVDLAAAKEEKVLKLWQGLGYYSRARNLHASAQWIVQENNGVFPQDYKAFYSLKGLVITPQVQLHPFVLKNPKLL